MQQGQAVSGLSVESYLQLHKALTKQSDCVQSVTPIEECYYKIGDLRQLLVLHGLTASKFNKSELLASLKGQKLINLACSSSSSSGSNGNLQMAEQQGTDATNDPELPFSAADMCSVLGVTGPSSDNPQPLKFLQLGPAAPFPVPLPLPTSDPVAAAAPGPQAPHEPALASASDQAAAQPTSCDHDDAAPHKQQQQQPAMQQPPSTQQNAITSAQQVQHAPQTQQQQQQQQHVHAMACPNPPAAAQAASQADPLHQLLATLLTQHTAGPAAGGMLQVPTTQPPQQATAVSIPTTAELLQQLLAQNAGRPQVSSNSIATQPAAAATLPQPAAIAATLPAHPPLSSMIQQGTTANPATELQLASTPEPRHTPWLKPQLEWFIENGLRLQQPLAAAAAMCANKGCGGLLGHRVGFMLLEDMQVAGPRNVILTLPPGFYEGMAVKYLGGSCQSEVCEMNCPGQHQFYRARILPPRALPEPGNSAAAGGELAVGLAQAHAATTGRPVLLILDLHPCLRSRSLEGLLQIPTADKLQDAWVLLEHDGDDVGAAGLQEPHADEVVPAEPAAQRKSRKPGRPAGSQNKRART